MAHFLKRAGLLSQRSRKEVLPQSMIWNASNETFVTCNKDGKKKSRN
jgi:hypothetical protein